MHFPSHNPSVVESSGSRGAPAGPQLLDVGRDEEERENGEDEKPSGKKGDLKSEIRQMLTVRACVCEKETGAQLQGERERRQRGLAELVLLLLWPPSPLLAGPLEVFQRTLLYLIKASQAPGKASRPAIFLHFPQIRAGIQKESLDKKQPGHRIETLNLRCFNLLWLLHFKR